MKRFYEINPLIHQKEYYPDSGVYKHAITDKSAVIGGSFIRTCVCDP
jgi:hypothetical protein